ncbi:ATP-binding cassette domain-containing protein [Candidatus Dependentiae bacterium]|nr:ATP-binding cassette domain-containing protein [Candidatus Dependentiae bacterium]
MINAQNLNLVFSEQVIFNDISFNIQDNQKIGLVGRNGSGKTTLLKVIAGQQELDSGKMNIPKDFKIAYMPQDVVLLSEKTVLHEAFNVFNNLGDFYFKFKSLEKKIQNSTATIDDIENYSNLQNKLNENLYEEKLVDIKKVLYGLGFGEQQIDKLVSQLSVGWKMRLVLAKLLLQKADFYLFDEPTNHLDIFARDWFLSFLKNSKFGFILVSHDRYFLDNLCKEIFELSMGNLNVYKGNYSSYRVKKERRMELLEKKQQEQQKEIKRKREIAERFRAKATKAKMAQSILKSLEKIDLIELEHQQKSIKIKLPRIVRSGKIVLCAKNLSISFGDKKIFKNISFEIERGEKVAIVAPNGVGKTTLLNIIMRKFKPTSGSFEFGYNVIPSYFEQDQNRSLNLKKDIFQEIEDSCTTSEARAKVRNYLGAFLFTGDDVYKKIRVLSGGEKNRVAMVKVLLKDANFLILDEPTNHLDLDSKEILLDVLKQYKGTILFVSHDRNFLNKLATNVIDLTPNGAFSYDGNYDSYLYQKAPNELKESTKTKKNDEVIVKHNNKNSYEQRKRIGKIESKMYKLEKELEKETEKLQNVEYGSNSYYKTCSKIKDLEEKIAQNLEEWEKLNG